MPPTDSSWCLPQKTSHLGKKTNPKELSKTTQKNCSLPGVVTGWDFSYYQSLYFQLHSRLAGGTSLSPVGWKTEVKKKLGLPFELFKCYIISALIAIVFSKNTDVTLRTVFFFFLFFFFLTVILPVNV